MHVFFSNVVNEHKKRSSAQRESETVSSNSACLILMFEMNKRLLY
jgi:hypothetical protein